jgi:NAD(P)-dependent dehydrogenase (short-subunit alcohol dehydrogenase family)
LAGRAALVTGGAAGLGAGIASALGAAGARVVVADITTHRSGAISAARVRRGG